MSSSRSEFWQGVRAELPLLVGVIPFGMIYGVLALGTGMPASAAQAMSAVVFAGSAQFVTAQMIAVGTPGLIIILTIAVVNLRHALYSASLAPYLQHLQPYWKWLLAYLLTDEAYAVAVIRYQREEQQPPQSEPCDPGQANRAPSKDKRHWFFLGCGLALWVCWQLSTALGIFVGQVLPDNWSLDFTLALTFIAMLVPVLRDRAAVVAGLTAGVVGVLAAAMPLKLGLITAAFAGILAGIWMENRK